MRQKITILIAALCLLPVFAKAQQDYRIEPSPWAFSWGAGLGTMVPSANLADNFKAGFAADTEVAIYYNKAFLMINGGFSTNALARDIAVVMLNEEEESTTWPSGSNALHAFIGANVGVNLLTADQITFYPYAGIGYGFIEPNLKTANSDPILSALKLNSFLWNAGIGLDYNFPDKEYSPGKINRILKVGLRYQFQKPYYEKEVGGFEGATHWLTLRFVIGSSMPGKAVYY